MKGARPCAALAAALCAALPATGAEAQAGAGELVRTSTVQVGPGERVLEALLADVDGLGRDDLVLARAAGDKRVLAIHLRGDEARFDPTPWRTLELTPDVVAYAVADVHADPGREVLLFNARGAFAWRPRAPREERVTRLVEADFLWQLAPEGALFAWPAAVVDLDRDGLPDLLLPEPGGYRVAFQRQDETGRSFGAPQRLRLPVERGPSLLEDAGARSHAPGPRASAGGGRIELAFEGDGDGAELARGPWLEHRDELPAVRALDFDGDGALDLLALGARFLFVWRQEPRGRFAEEPTLVLASPVERDLGRLLDPSFAVHALELGGARGAAGERIDCVFVARDRRASELRTQVLVYVQESESPPLFGAEGVPRQVLAFAGLVASARFADVDGDGREDLVLVVVRPDLIDAVRAASLERLDAQVLVHLNRGGRLSPRPDLTHSLSLGAGLGERALRFAGDVDGDGLAELFVRDGAQRLSLFSLRRTRAGLELLARPSVEIALPEGAVGRWPQGLARELVFVAEREVVCLAWR